jgi:hypothetical protein
MVLIEGREYLDQLRYYEKVTNAVLFLKIKNAQENLFGSGFD